MSSRFFIRKPHRVASQTVGVCWVALLASPIGCGEPIVDRQYPGKPLLHVTGVVVDIDMEPTPQYPLRASLFWSPTGSFNEQSIATMFQDNTVRVDLDLPATFTLTVFNPPKQEWAVPGRGYAVGTLILYEDRVGQGRFIPGQTPIKGGSPYSAIFYSPTQIDHVTSPFQTTIGPGMVRLSLPLPCGEVYFPSETQLPTPECNVGKIGDPCQSAQDCAVHEYCLHYLEGQPLPNGYCSRVATPACRPAQTVVMGGLQTQDDGSQTTTDFLARSCVSDTQCRKSEGYVCDPFARACLPEEPMLLLVQQDFEFEALCEESAELDKD